MNSENAAFNLRSPMTVTDRTATMADISGPSMSSTPLPPRPIPVVVNHPAPRITPSIPVDAQRPISGRPVAIAPIDAPTKPRLVPRDRGTDTGPGGVVDLGGSGIITEGTTLTGGATGTGSTSSSGSDVDRLIDLISQQANSGGGGGGVVALPSTVTATDGSSSKGLGVVVVIGVLVIGYFIYRAMHKGKEK